MTDVVEPNDDIEPDEPEQEGEYRPTRGVLAQEGYEGEYQEEDAESDE